MDISEVSISLGDGRRRTAADGLSQDEIRAWMDPILPSGMQIIRLPVRRPTPVNFLNKIKVPGEEGVARTGVKEQNRPTGKPTSTTGKAVKREDYVVRDAFMQRILELMPTPDGADDWRDMFSTAATVRFSDFVNCAATADWGELQKVLWINPPFSLWRETALQVQSSKSRCVCLVPDWGKDYEHDLLTVAIGRWYIPSGTPLFQLDGQRSQPTRWGCWLLDIPQAPRPVIPKKEMCKVTILSWNKSEVKSAGKKRRERAARVKQRCL